MKVRITVELEKGDESADLAMELETFRHIGYDLEDIRIISYSEPVEPVKMNYTLNQCDHGFVDTPLKNTYGESPMSIPTPVRPSRYADLIGDHG
jgi:hypothetical protein